MISVRNGTWLQIHVSMQMVKYIFKTKGLVLKIREYFLPHSQCYKHVKNILAFPDIITLFRWSGDWENLRVSFKGETCFVSLLEMVYVSYFVGRDISVVIATRYGLDGPGIESRWERNFPQLSRPALVPTQPALQWVLGLSWRWRAAEAWRWLLAPPSAVGHERVDLYLYSPYGPYGLYRASVPVQGCTLPLPLPLYNHIDFISLYFYWCCWYRVAPSLPIPAFLK